MSRNSTPLPGNVVYIVLCIPDVCLRKSRLLDFLRHTFATRLLSRTSSHQEIKAVAELPGDDYKVVVKTYLHTGEDGKHNLVDMLNE